MNAPTRQPLHIDLPGPATPEPPVRLRRRTPPDLPMRRPHELLGQRLVAASAISPADLLKALALQAREEARLGDILVAQGMVLPETLLGALAEQWGAQVVDLTREPPDTRLIDAVGVTACLEHGLVPWRRAGGVSVVATARPERFRAQQAALETRLGPVVMALAPEQDIARAVATLRSRTLARRAETRVPQALSCREPLARSWRMALGGLALGAALCALLAPAWLFAALLGWAALTLAALCVLRLAVLSLAVRPLRRGRIVPAPAPFRPEIMRLPIVSVIVPLFQEADIAGRLLQRLSRLDYPRELTDIVLVCEEDDATTAQALYTAHLPPWVRVVQVPRGGLQTKPRALNYALDFCLGQIVGVWDAEDAPAPDQLHRVVRQFHERGPEVACLQGILDYYNSGTNWLSRCFTIEYAAWFRVMLPGLQRLGLAVPLGGTTVFFRRKALEALGGWDAHNVTEDADLGLRLARAGYRTEMIDSVTAEEANCRLVPWVRQRSRWLKGYAQTWAVHMRRPAELHRDLGTRAFLGVQVLFLGTLSQFVLAPVLWSCWALAFGLPHPLGGALPAALSWGLLALFLVSEALSLAIGLMGLRHAGKLRLAGWLPSLHIYFPLAALAAYKGLFELFVRPFFWDKTPHGASHVEEALPVRAIAAE